MPSFSAPILFVALAFAITVLSGAVYLLSSWLQGGSLGYPLDDSWIHQTLARNLAVYGQLAVNLGEPAAVSTAPSWTLLLLPGYLLNLPPMLWTYLLGVGSLVFLAWETVLLGRALLPPGSSVPYLAGLLVLLEWHLVWAAFSGMETLLFAALTLAILREGIRDHPARPWLLGLLVGLLTLTRPEGILLGALLGGWSVFVTRRGRWRPLFSFGFVLFLTLLPGVLLNLALGGRPLPSTFYAKHAAYGAGLDVLFYLQYLLGAVTTLARGPLLLAYPGLVYGLALRFPGLAAAWLLPLGWAALLLAVYMVWLPALYHHGRYLFPLIPLVALYGLEGGRLLLARLPFTLLPRVAPLLLVFVAALSWVRGAQVYGENVRSINQQQVRLALWIRDHAPPGALVGTHDIGALGYFSQRKLVDIAGLASPELIASPKDVPRILQVLREKHVTYLVLLPEWYPPLYQRLLMDSWREVATQVTTQQETWGGSGTFKVLKLVEKSTLE